MNELDERWAVVSRALSVVFVVGGRAGWPCELPDDYDLLDPGTWRALAAQIDDLAVQLAGPCEWMARVVGAGDLEVLRGVAVEIHSEARDAWPEVDLEGDWAWAEQRRQDDDAALVEAWARAADQAPEQPLLASMQRIVAHLAPELALAEVEPMEMEEDEEDGAVILDALTDLLEAEQRLLAQEELRATRRLALARHALGMALPYLWTRQGRVPLEACRRVAGALALLEAGWPG